MGISGPCGPVRRQLERPPDRTSVDGTAAAHAARERRFIDSMITRLRDEPELHSWEQGASGERIVGARLDRIAGIEVLHDRRIPGARANIEHIAVGPAGVFVIDAKLYAAPIAGGASRLVSRRSDHVVLGGHDRSKLVAKLRVRTNAIARALGDAPIPVLPALCFVEAPEPAFSRPFTLDGVWVGSPAALPELVSRPGLLDAEAMRATTARLEARLPEA